MNIVIVIPTLMLGGAEKLAVLQAAEFTKRGANVTLMTLAKTPDFYSVPPGVKRMALDILQTPFYVNPAAPFIRMRILKKEIAALKPDIVISHMSVVACYGAYAAKVPFIFAEHSNIYTRKLWPQKTFILRRAACAVVLSKVDQMLFESRNIKTKIVYNPALKPDVQEDKKPAFFGEKTVLAAGRLVKEKGFDMLLEAWSMIKDKKGFKLVIAGEGPERENLDSSVLVGSQHDMGALYKYADIFALSSRTEAFPLALCEAMSFGLPVVAFKVTGADVIVRDNKDGFLIEKENVPAFSKALEILINDEEKRKEFSANAAKITERFSLASYINSYEEIIKSIIEI